MHEHPIAGTLIGTFDGRTGDQRAMMESKIDVLYRGSHIHEESEERVHELALRAHKPVDETRIELDFPEHGVDQLLSALQNELEE